MGRAPFPVVRCAVPLEALAFIDRMPASRWRVPDLRAINVSSSLRARCGLVSKRCIGLIEAGGSNPRRAVLEARLLLRWQIGCDWRIQSCLDLAHFPSQVFGRLRIEFPLIRPFVHSELGALHAQRMEKRLPAKTKGFRRCAGLSVPLSVGRKLADRSIRGRTRPVCADCRSRNLDCR